MYQFEDFLKDFKRRQSDGPFYEPEEVAIIKGDHILETDTGFNIDYESYGGYDYDLTDSLNKMHIKDFCIRNFLQINRYMESISKKNGKNIDFICFSQYDYYFYFEGLRKELKTFPYLKEEFEFPTENSMICKSTISAYRDVSFYELMAAAYNYELETGNEVKSISFVKEIEMEV